MLTMNPESDTVKARFLLEDFLSFEAPEGYRVELINGEIVVTPPPSGNHDRAFSRIVWQIARNSAVDMDFSGTKGLIVPSGGVADAGRAIPDATFAPAKLDLFHGAGSWMPSSGVAMVLEVTSSHPNRDREDKRRAYAEAGIPLYLLADRGEKQVVLFANPDGKDYLQVTKAPFGRKLDLPKPFDFTLDTAPFDE